ncbi:ATP-binding protein [Candidatus Bathyarchaeota archaeon]|nr:ATP-binding protein [Candidatus Bathyarchaeota archaeon]
MGLVGLEIRAMRLYKKTGNTIHIISFPDEDVEKGCYLIIDDKRAGRSMIVQVIDVQFANVPGIMEELLREPLIDDPVKGDDIDPFDITSHILYVQDARLLVCKVHGTIEDGGLCSDSSWLPSRTHSTICRLPIGRLMDIVNASIRYPISIGETMEGTPMVIDASILDGKLNIITGRKGVGKSHLSKILVLGLISYGATVVVFDLNGEYKNLGLNLDGERNEFYEKVHVLVPGENFKVTLAQTGLSVVMKILVHALNLPGTSAREFRHIWRFLEERNMLSLHEIGEAIRRWQCNQQVKDALFSRYYTLLHANFFTDNVNESVNFEGLLQNVERSGGGAIIIDLSNSSSVDRQIVVEYILAKLQDLLSQWKIRAVFLFAEEAHLYLRETYWDDIVTRMRHFGIFTTFITNQPDTIKESIYRQADNIFLFNFVNEHDLEVISRAAKVDAETTVSIVRDLPPHHCLILGDVVRNFPIVAKVKPLNVRAMGETRLFFSREKGLEAAQSSRP